MTGTMPRATQGGDGMAHAIGRRTVLAGSAGLAVLGTRP